MPNHFDRISQKFSALNLFSQSFEELAKCSQDLLCGKCDVSKYVAYRHILKSIEKELKEKSKKFCFLNLN